MLKLLLISCLFFLFRPVVVFSQVPVEKIYIQTDRNRYEAGETIYFKGYILSDQDTVESSTLFVELWDDNFLKLAETIVPVVDAGSAGSISIPVGLKNSQVFLRAYTDYSASQPNPFQFVKPVLYNTAFGMLPGAVHPDLSLPVFFPEGGSLVYDAINYVAFKGPENFLGTIRNSKGITIAEIKPDYKGMGSFFITPVKGERYSCFWKPDGKEQVIPLPLPVEHAVALHIRQSADSLYFDIDRGESLHPGLQRLKVQLMISNEIGYLVELNLTSRSRYSYFIPLTEFRAGMAEVRVLDASDSLVASRPVFINRHSMYKGANMEIIKKDLGKRGENKISLRFTDTTLRYISVGITDAAYNEPAGYPGIMAPGHWMSGTTVSPYNYGIHSSGQLDLFLLTSGIPAINKNEINERTIPVPGKNFQLSGTVKKGKKVYAGKDLLVGVRSAYTGKELFKVITDEHGKFLLNGLIVYDEVMIHCRIPGKGVEDLSVELSLIKPAASPLPDFFSRFIETIKAMGAGQRDTSLVTASPVNNAISTDALIYSDKSITLQEVVLNPDNNMAAWKRRMEMEDKYVSGSNFSGYYASGESLDVLNDPETQFYRDLFSYMAAKLRSVTSRFINGERQLIYSGSIGEQRVSTFYIGNLQADRSMLNTISLDEVAMVKFIPRLGSERGFPAALAIFLKKPGDQGYWEKDRYQLQEKKFIGYKIPKEFVEPDYSNPETRIERDNRKSLLWKPFIPLDKGVAEIRFFNTDRTKKIRIVVEAMAEDGSLISFEIEIE